MAPFLGAAEISNAASPRVPADFFGVNFQNIYYLHPSLAATHAETMSDLGITQARTSAPWTEVEPSPTDADTGYHWRNLDEQVGALARGGVQAQLTLGATPPWATSNNVVESSLCRSVGSSAQRPAAWAMKRFADYTAAVAARYGRGGTFWSQSGISGPPVVSYEIWNEPNLVGTWCPRPEPELWADMFVAAREAILAVDPHADLVTAGVTFLGANHNPPNLTPREFLRRAIARQPSIATVPDAAAFHVYPSSGVDNQLEMLVRARDELRTAGVSDRVPLLLNEIGWNTRGHNSVTEAERVQRYERLARQLSRTNCNVNGITAHAWITDEARPDHYNDWYGITSPASAPYPSAYAFGDGIRLMRGMTATEPPRTVVDACAGMPTPDSDGDGVRDPSDYYPHDPARTDSTDGSGGSGTGTDPGEPTTDCASRIEFLEARRQHLKAKRAVYRPSARRGHEPSRSAVRRLSRKLRKVRRELRRLRATCS